MRHFMMMVTAILLPVSATALDLATARTQNKVCELPDGYVKALGEDAQSLAAEVNAKRRAAYAQIASENQQTVAVAGQLAHSQIIAKGVASCK